MGNGNEVGRGFWPQGQQLVYSLVFLSGSQSIGQVHENERG